MRTRDAIDRDTRAIVLRYIRKYKEYNLWLEEERRQLLSIRSQDYENLDMPRQTDLTDSTEQTVMRLDELETCHKALVVKAIEHAKLTFLALEEAENREVLLNKIWLSCIDSRTHNYEANFGGLYCSRKTFSRKKSYFIKLIAENLNLV